MTTTPVRSIVEQVKEAKPTRTMCKRTTAATKTAKRSPAKAKAVPKPTKIAVMARRLA